MTAHERVAITGNTYPVRQELEALGGIWDAAQRAWLVPAGHAEEARALAGRGPRWICDECGCDDLMRPRCYRCGETEMIRQIK